ncbi:hypothetical protein N0V93_001398 [Gnomoniopsis smithogilvyi]|uniref:Uncharacterized protein n=1 Tax=Gnomoniopsis smithogilvyi TaxID=1191159 RepID=A0A9W9D266_9PEZI|nr:hypothetical protein N0V93_001398 [Gnomoniopsis smithogilvyi]
MLFVIFRGFKVSVAALDAFFQANSIAPTMSIPPFEPDEGEQYDEPRSRQQMEFLSTRLQAAGGDAEAAAKIFIPATEQHDRSRFAYVAYCWMFVYSQRRLQLDNDLPEAVPPSFDTLRQEIMGFVNDSNESIQGLGEIFLYSLVSWERSHFPRAVKETLRQGDYSLPDNA